MERPGIVPLSSNAFGLRWEQLAPRPAFQAPAREDVRAGPLFGEMGHTGVEAPAAAGVPSALERRLRHRIGELLAAQVIEEEEALRLPRGVGNYHRLNAVLKRALCGRKWGEMNLAELEATLGWLERHRLADHLHLLEDDARYAHEARRVATSEQRRQATEGHAALDASQAQPQAQPELWRRPVGRPWASVTIG